MPPTASKTIVPALSKYSGTLKDLNGKPITYPAGVTFSIYTSQEGGDPLWTEMQNEPDQSGHYTVTLGSTTSKGLPADVFESGEARWLGVRIVGQISRNVNYHEGNSRLRSERRRFYRQRESGADQHVLRGPDSSMERQRLGVRIDPYEYYGRSGTHGRRL